MPANNTRFTCEFMLCVTMRCTQITTKCHSFLELFIRVSRMAS